jgi:large repetitive protein
MPVSMTSWLRGKKATASATALAVLIATPVTFAVLHQGFPLSDVDLSSLDVWVTNSDKARVGRLNMQIKELNASADTASNSFDVLQNGDAIFVYDETASSVQRIDPALVKLQQSITVPVGAAVAFGDSTMAIVDGATGAVWVIGTDQELSFDTEAPPVGEFGAGTQAVVTHSGIVFIASPDDGMLYRVDSPGADAIEVAPVAIDSFELTAVGDHPVVLDLDNNALILDDGGTAIPIDGTAVRVQQVSDARDSVVVATGDSLVRVPLDRSAQQVFDAEISTGGASADTVSAPVVLGSCIHGAWSSAQRYMGICDNREPAIVDIRKNDGGGRLEFRVNRKVVALNNLKSGGVWLVDDAETRVDNWEEVTAPEPTEGPEGDSKVTTESFEETLKNRDPEVNTPPTAVDDTLGVRPGRTTILAVLDNDIDVDGDVLAITEVAGVAEEVGTVDVIDGGRALQFTPVEGATGTASFQYTVSDGRAGGVAQAQVNATITPFDLDQPPQAKRVSQISVEARQTVSYNVLSDWIDPDGDDLVLTGAVSTSGDVVRFLPDGQVTFTNTSSELGLKTVAFTVTAGALEAAGELVIDVKAPGTLTPIATPDFAQTFISQPVQIHPLDNDSSPSGAPLQIQAVMALSSEIAATVDTASGIVTATAGVAGVYYLQYTLVAGAKEGAGLIRVDVREDPAADTLPPIAVKDVAYARPNEPVTISPLANDISPSGRVLGIQSVDISTEIQGLSVEVLASAVLRITLASATTEPVSFTYTISDGLKQATAGVTVVPVPALTKHQAPIAVNDAITVRAGDIATVAVLDNDFHPDGARMVLDQAIVEQNLPEDGIAFITGDKLRVQAPSNPSIYTATYRISDSFAESATATVTITVLAPNEENNQPPVPRDLTARVFAGAKVTVPVPLDGLDPDGDSVVFLTASGAKLGKVLEGSSQQAFVYEASTTTGTDTFTYTVRDSAGTTATGNVRIGIISPPETVLPPVAKGDEIFIRPGATAAVPVLDNDSDPSNLTVSLEPKLGAIDAGLAAKVVTPNVLVTAGKVEGVYLVEYEISNTKGATDTAYITVHVDKNAPAQSPTAVDQVVADEDAVGRKTVEVDPLTDATLPGGVASDLEWELVGPNAAFGERLDTGLVSVTLGDTRRAIAYKLTNPADGLFATAFIIVPAYVSDAPPKLRDPLEPQVVRMNGSIEWNIADLVDVPSKKPIRIVSPTTAVAMHSNGDPVATDETRLKYTPAKEFRGQSYVDFDVTDGISTARISVPVTVGDAESADISPEFANSSMSIEAGESATELDLRSATSHPNPKILNAVTYSIASGQTSDIQATLNGSLLSVSAPKGVQPDTTTTVKITLKYADFTVDGEIAVRTVRSTRPLTITVDDVELEGRASTPYTMSVFANDRNPFEADGDPLAIKGTPIFDGDNLGASISNTSSTVTVNTGTAKSGTINVIYTAQDQTKDPTRDVQGRITIVVASAPEPVTSISLSNPGSQQVNAVFQAPASSNGAVITGYTVQVSGAQGTAQRTDCVPGANCAFTGRTNGDLQTITVSATNKVGTTISGPSTITPYGVPTIPTNVVLSTNSATANATITPTWSGPGDSGGGSLTFEWAYTQGVSGSDSTAGNVGAAQVVGQGNYAFQVRACNPGGCSAFAGASVSIAAPPPSASVSDGGLIGGGPAHYLRLNVANFVAGSYTVKCYADGTNGGTTAYQSAVMSLPANGFVITPCPGVSGPANNPGWLMIEVVGVLYTGHYTPWT